MANILANIRSAVVTALCIVLVIDLGLVAAATYYMGGACPEMRAALVVERRRIGLIVLITLALLLLFVL